MINAYSGTQWPLVNFVHLYKLWIAINSIDSHPVLLSQLESSTREFGHIDVGDECWWQLWFIEPLNLRVRWYNLYAKLTFLLTVGKCVNCQFGTHNCDPTKNVKIIYGVALGSLVWFTKVRVIMFKIPSVVHHKTSDVKTRWISASN